LTFFSWGIWMELNKIIKNLDYGLLTVVGFLILAGLLMVYSSTHLKVPGKPDFFLVRQIMATILGLAVGFVFLFHDYRISDRACRILYGLNIGMLLLVLSPLGREVNGAKSWLFFFQPAEICKIILIVTLANYLTKKEDLHSFYSFIGPFLYTGIPALLIIAQPNLGTALVFIFFTFVMMYIAGASGIKLLAVIMAGMLCIAVVFLSHYYLHTPLPVKSYQINRLTSFTNPEKDRTGAGWQLTQAMIAVGSGQFFGKGYLRGTQGRLGFLPENHTDFIFSVLSEELGFIGSFGIIFFYFLMIWHEIKISLQAKDKTGCLIATGIVSMFLFHVMENIGMNLGIMPVAGIPLPFISFGGTAMVANLSAIGIISNIWIHHQKIMF
jgi:rod shape determining protein RodA